MSRFRYLTNCIDAGMAKREALYEMIARSRPVTWETFRRHVDADEVAEMFGTHPHVKDDHHVSFYSSRYQGKHCYYLEHSAIEYIWTE